MGIGKLLEEVVGAVAAEKGVEALNPNASFITKAAAAVAGFEGVKAVTNKLGDRADDQAQDAADAAADTNNQQS